MSIISLLAGPVIGVVGSALSAFAQYKSKQLDLQIKDKEHAHEIRLQELSIQTRQMELESEERIAQTNASAAMLEASYRHDASYGLPSPKAAMALRLVRPLLTIGLVGLAAYFFIDSEDEALKGQIVTTTLFLMEVAVSWWFADRARQATREKR